MSDSGTEAPSLPPYGSSRSVAPTFRVPFNYGTAGSIDSMTSVAAPLLAGGSIALMGVVVQQQDAIRFPGFTILLLLCCAVLLVAAVQAGFWAKQYAVTPAEIAAWYPTMKPEVRWARVRADQWDHSINFDRWAGRARWAYGIGIIFLWAGIAVAVTPLPSDSEGGIRLAAAGLAAAAAVVELVWLICARFWPNAVPLLRPVSAPRLPPEAYPRTDENDPYMP